MASTALSAGEGIPGTDSQAAPLAGSAELRVLDWPCCAAPSIHHAWTALATRTADPNPFHESWYLLPSLRMLDAGETVQALLYEVGGELCGIMPIGRQKRYYGWRIPHLAGWTHPNSFLGVPLIANGHEEAFWRAVLDWADKLPGAGLFLHLAGVPLSGPAYAALIRIIREQRRPHGLVHLEERALLSSHQSPEAYFSASLSGKKRKELRRQLTRLSEQGEVAFARQQDEQGVGEWIDRFLDLEAAGWKGKAGSALASDPATEALFRQSLTEAATLGRLERLSLTLDGRPIAMLANFITPPGAYSYKTTFDEAYSRYSPGVLLQCENLMLLDRDNIDWTDSCAAEGHPMIDHIWRERRTIGRLSIGIGGKWKQAAFRKLLKAELARTPIGISA
jgi:CelD/BcsL family acetyltransferase involved in cellulose biosynthesis